MSTASYGDPAPTREELPPDLADVFFPPDEDEDSVAPEVLELVEEGFCSPEVLSFLAAPPPAAGSFFPASPEAGDFARDDSRESFR